MRRPTLWTIRYEEPARIAIHNASERWNRTEDAVMTVEFALLRDRTVGVTVTESGMVRAITLPGAVSIGLPTVTALYEIQEVFELIVIHSLRFEDAKPEEKATVH